MDTDSAEQYERDRMDSLRSRGYTYAEARKEVGWDKPCTEQPTKCVYPFGGPYFKSEK